MRKASAQLLSNDNFRKSGKFGKYQHAETIQLMWDLAHDPEVRFSDSSSCIWAEVVNAMQAWFLHMKHYTTSFALGIIYGKRGPTLSSPDVVDFLNVHPKFLHALEIGTMPPVDLFPALTLVPERWAKWKRTVKNIRFLHESLYDKLLQSVENRMSSGHGSGVFMEQAIENAAEWGLSSREHLM